MAFVSDRDKKMAQECVIHLGEEVKLQLLHNKEYAGTLMCIFVKEKFPLVIPYLRFDKDGLERIITLPDILAIERG